MSLRSKIEPAAINIERDITKCLTWHGFFIIFNCINEIILTCYEKNNVIDHVSVGNVVQEGGQRA